MEALPLKPEMRVAGPPALAASQIYGTFIVADTEVTLPAEDVREVVPFPSDMVPLPLVPPYVLGVFSLRGEVMPVIDVARLLGLPASGRDATLCRVAVIDCGTHCVGALFQATGEVLEVRPEDIKPLTHPEKGSERIVSGLLSLDSGRRLIQVLSAELIAHVRCIPRGERTARDEVVHKPMTKLVVVSIGEISLAIPVARVLEIHHRLPLAMQVDWFEGCMGLVELRGESVAVMDLGGRLGRLGAANDTGRMVFVSDDTAVCGLLVDSVVRVVDVPNDDIVAVPILSHFRCGECIGSVARGVGDNTLLLDVEKLFAISGVNGALPDGNGRALLAHDDVTATTILDDQQYLEVNLGGQSFGIEMQAVQEIQEHPGTLIHHPGSDESFLGLLELRGCIVPVIDPHARYGLPSHVGTADDTRIVILRVRGGLRGLVVDGLKGLVRGSDGDRLDSQLKSSNVSGKLRHVDHVVGILHLTADKGGRTVLLLDAEAALGDDAVGADVTRAALAS